MTFSYPTSDMVFRSKIKVTGSHSAKTFQAIESLVWVCTLLSAAHRPVEEWEMLHFTVVYDVLFTEADYTDKPLQHPDSAGGAYNAPQTP